MLVNRFFIFPWNVRVMIYRPKASRASLEFRGVGGRGIPGNSLWGRDARFSKSCWPYFRQKMVIFYTSFQTWCRQKYIMLSLLRLERQEKDFVKAISNCLLLFLSYSVRIETTNTALHSRIPSISTKIYTRFQTKTGQTLFPLGRHIPIRQL